MNWFLKRYASFDLLKWIGLSLMCSLVVMLSGCSLPQVRAEDRIFLDLSIDYLGEYTLPKQDFQETPVGGLSGLAYDRQTDRFYAISDDRSNLAPARFYTLKLVLDGARQTLDRVEIEQVTSLKGEDGQPYAAGSVDFEGIALSPRRSLYIASEGVTEDGIPPQIYEFDLEGNWLGKVPMPLAFLPNPDAESPTGAQNNKSLEALTIPAGGYGATELEPFRLFTATELPLLQDLPDDPQQTLPIRLLHYYLSEDQQTLLSEHLYPIDPLPEGADGGLAELLTIDQSGHFLSLERSFDLATGVQARLYQIETASATDVSKFTTLKEGTQTVSPIRKQLLLDLAEAGLPLENYEGMTLGPQLGDGSTSLVMVSDDNFNPLQVTRFLLYRLGSGE